MAETQPQTPTGFAEKADHRAVHFEIKAAAANVVSSGHSSGQDLPQETQMNVRRLLIVKKRESGYESVERNRRAPAATDLPRAAAVCSGCKLSTFFALLRSYQATGGHHHSARLQFRAMVRRLELHRTTARRPVPCRGDLHWQWHLSIAGWDLYRRYPTRDGHELLEQCSLSERVSVWLFWRDNE